MHRVQTLAGSVMAAVSLPALGTPGSVSKGDFMGPGSNRALQFVTQVTWPASQVYIPVCSLWMFTIATPV